jgi:uncharacterized membrane protein YqaE (UPF0057 family)
LLNVAVVLVVPPVGVSFAVGVPNATGAGP